MFWETILTLDTFCGRFRPDVPIAGSGAVAVSSLAGGDDFKDYQTVSAVAEGYVATTARGFCGVRRSQEQAGEQKVIAAAHPKL